MHGLHRRVFVAILIGFAVYAAAWIWRTSGVVHGERFFLLADDPMISMRYARNVAAGFGAVWNRGGPRVEGFSNPLWVAVMAAVHLLPLPTSKIPLVIELLAVALLTWNLFAVRRLTLRSGGDDTA